MLLQNECSKLERELVKHILLNLALKEFQALKGRCARKETSKSNVNEHISKNNRNHLRKREVFYQKDR